MEIPEAVRRQALHPFRELPVPPGFRTVERRHTLACLHPLPTAQAIEPRDLGPGDVEAAVEDARTLVREHGRSLLVWIVGPDLPWLGPRLEELGLVNEDTAGFESVENAMALVEPPAGTPPPDVQVTWVRTFSEFVASQRVTAEAFELTGPMRAELEAGTAQRYEEYMTPDTPLRQLNALIDGRVVGTATAALGPAGVNLYGGAVLPDARGRGVYRALTAARWNLAVRRGTPALTIQAGRMATPIAARLGFELVGALHVYVDDFTPR